MGQLLTWLARGGWPEVVGRRREGGPRTPMDGRSTIRSLESTVAICTRIAGGQMFSAFGQPDGALETPVDVGLHDQGPAAEKMQKVPPHVEHLGPRTSRTGMGLFSHESGTGTPLLGGCGEGSGSRVGILYCVTTLRPRIHSKSLRGLRANTANSREVFG